MGRSELIARSIVRAVAGGAEQPKRSFMRRLARAVLLFFKIFDLPIQKLWPEVFASLRIDCWGAREDDYQSSFKTDSSSRPEEALSQMGDLGGYSGSTFFTTSDKRWLVKSVPRAFENSFFHDDLLHPYAAHMSAHQNSLLVRISDFLATAQQSLGTLLGLAPTHHIVMENIMYGSEQASADDGSKWESWDLKPTSYFYPERDVAAGMLASEATKSKLADKFDDKIVLRQEQADQLLEQLAVDTSLLCECNAVDYSLFLVRIKLEHENPFADPAPSAPAGIVPRVPPFVPPEPPSWRSGVKSADGKYVFRAVILDFFWAKHKMQPKVMTGLVKLWNVAVSRQGHMSITTTPEEYKGRFLKMCREIVEIKKD